MKKTKNNNRLEFSKQLLLQESMLIWIITIAFIILAFVCVSNQYFGELPWLAAMCGFPWSAYGASQAFYFRKAESITYGDIIVGIEDSKVEMKVQGKFSIVNMIFEWFKSIFRNN